MSSDILKKTFVTCQEIEHNGLADGEAYVDEETGIDTGFDPKFVGSNMPARTGMAINSFNPKKAEEFLTYNVYKDQRPAKEKRKEELSRKMKDNRFHGSDVVIANLSYDYIYENEDGQSQSTRKLMINGQHTCWAIIDSDTTQLVVVKEFAVANPHQLMCLYAQFDAPGGQRSAADIAQTYMCDLAGFTKKAITLIAASCEMAATYQKKSLVKHDHDHSLLTIEERIELMKSAKYLPAAQFANKLCYETEQQAFLRRKGVIAVMVMSYQTNPTTATVFWNKVQTGANCSSESPELTIRNWLSNVVVRSGTNLRGKKSVAISEIFQQTLKAWNSAQKGQTMKRITQPRQKKAAK